MALTATIYHVDLTQGRIETTTIPEDIYRRYPGGSALAAYLVLHTTPIGADPLGPDNALVMAVSPLTGLAISGQSRMTACARSPLTGAIGDSQCGGFFPAEMRNAGADDDDIVLGHGRTLTSKMGPHAGGPQTPCAR